jgi:hypothetical protein
MTLAPQVIEQGPRHRLIVLPSGEQIIQHPKEYIRTFTAGINLPFEVRAKMSEVAERSTREQLNDGEEIIDSYITDWVAVELRDEDGILYPCTQARAGVIYWPAIPKGH